MNAAASELSVPKNSSLTLDTFEFFLSRVKPLSMQNNSKCLDSFSSEFIDLIIVLYALIYEMYNSNFMWSFDK